jgi:hypothetical protein
MAKPPALLGRAAGFEFYPTLAIDWGRKGIEESRVEICAGCIETGRRDPI